MDMKATKIIARVENLLYQLEKRERIFENIQTIENKISNDPELIVKFNELFDTNMKLEDITILRSDYFSKEICRLKEAINNATVLVDSNGFYVSEE
jgi:hypothetical protein